MEKFDIAAEMERNLSGQTQKEMSLKIKQDALLKNVEESIELLADLDCQQGVLILQAVKKNILEKK